MRQIIKNKLKELEFDDVNILRTILRSSEEEIQYFITNRKPKGSVHEEIMKDFEKSNFQSLESFLRAILLEEADMSFVLKRQKSVLMTYEIPPG